MRPWAGHLRLATDADGPAIGKLFAEAGLNDLGVDWQVAKPGGWWLVGDKGGQIVGAIQVMAGNPFGFIGDAVVHPSEQGRTDERGGLLAGTLTRLLYAWALETIRRNGGQIAVGVTDLPGMKALLARHGAQAVGEFTMFAKRLV